MTAPSMMLVPAAVPIGYGGEARVYAYNAQFFVTRSIYGPPSIVPGTFVEPPIHQAMYWPPVEHQADNQYLHPITKAQSPQVPTRGANRVPAGTRVTFRGPEYFVHMQAPSIDAVQAFMSARQP